MMNFTGDYWQFYLEGRGERLPRHDISEDDLVEEMTTKGTPLREAVLKASTQALTPLQSGKARRRWLDEHKDEIAAAGGDAELAHTAYIQGRVDELAYVLDREVVSALDERFSGEDENDEEEDDDENDEK